MRESQLTYSNTHGRTKEELIDFNYKKVRESCERIASVLGIKDKPDVISSLNEHSRINLGGNSITNFNAVNNNINNNVNQTAKTPTDYFSPIRHVGEETT